MVVCDNVYLEARVNSHTICFKNNTVILYILIFCITGNRFTFELLLLKDVPDIERLRVEDFAKSHKRLEKFGISHRWIYHKNSSVGQISLL